MRLLEQKRQKLPPPSARLELNRNTMLSKFSLQLQSFQLKKHTLKFLESLKTKLINPSDCKIERRLLDLVYAFK